MTFRTTVAAIDRGCLSHVRDYITPNMALIPITGTEFTRSAEVMLVCCLTSTARNSVPPVRFSGLTSRMNRDPETVGGVFNVPDNIYTFDISQYQC